MAMVSGCGVFPLSAQIMRPYGLLSLGKTKGGYLAHPCSLPSTGPCTEDPQHILIKAPSTETQQILINELID